MKPGFRDTVLSLIVFLGVLIALSSVDERLRQALPATARDVSAIGDKAGDAGNALLSAARRQSIDQQPMVVFVALGAALTVFMLRS